MTGDEPSAGQSTLAADVADATAADQRARRAAAERLAARSDADPAAVADHAPSLVAAIDDVDATTGGHIAMALYRSARAAPGAVLRELGTATDGGTDDLRDLLDADADRVRRRACGTLAALADHDPAVVPVSSVVPLLDADDRTTRWHAAEAMATVAEESPDSVAAAAGALADATERAEAAVEETLLAALDGLATADEIDAPEAERAVRAARESAEGAGDEAAERACDDPSHDHEGRRRRKAYDHGIYVVDRVFGPDGRPVGRCPSCEEGVVHQYTVSRSEGVGFQQAGRVGSNQGDPTPEASDTIVACSDMWGAEGCGTTWFGRGEQSAVNRYIEEARETFEPVDSADPEDVRWVPSAQNLKRVWTRYAHASRLLDVPCPECGSSDVRNHTQQRGLRLQLGAAVSGSSQRNYGPNGEFAGCDNCGQLWKNETCVWQEVAEKRCLKQDTERRRCRALRTLVDDGGNAADDTATEAERERDGSAAETATDEGVPDGVVEAIVGEWEPPAERPTGRAPPGIDHEEWVERYEREYGDGADDEVTNGR